MTRGFSLPGLEHLSVDRTLVMGILNVTPDSFSDGGRWLDSQAAVARGLEMLSEGADLLDVGGESTRPGSVRISPEEEQQRIIPVVSQLCQAGATVSVDTLHADTALRCVQEGAKIINDVSGGLADEKMAEVVSQTGVTYICQHWRGTPETMDELTDYGADVVGGVLRELDERVENLISAGVDKSAIVLDPGLGFAKNIGQCWTLLANLDRLLEAGMPVLIGASRKRFLEPIGGSPATRRDQATAAVTALAAAHGAWAVRVHDVKPSADAVRVAKAWKESR